MTQTEFIYFFIGVFSMFIGMFIYPHVLRFRMHIMQYFPRKKHTSNTIQQSQIDELQNQINNIAERLATRDNNRKHQVRREVREMLKEIADGKFDK